VQSVLCVLVNPYYELLGSFQSFDIYSDKGYRKIFDDSVEILLIEKNMVAVNEATQNGTEASARMKEYKAKMLDIHASPEDWTVEDLVKLKNDPKGKEIFKALVRVRNAIYDPEVPADVRKQLAQNLLSTMSEGTEASKLRGLLDRVKTVAGG